MSKDAVSSHKTLKKGQTGRATKETEEKKRKKKMMRSEHSWLIIRDERCQVQSYHIVLYWQVAGLSDKV